MSTLIVIPARWGSSRFPGKPMAMIAGRPLLEWVIELVTLAVGDRRDVSLVVATDDQRIADLATDRGCAAIMTSKELTSGSSRALAAAMALPAPPRWILNVQGDAPFTPVEAITRVMAALQEGAQVATPVVQLTWQELDELRRQKRETPFSGTTCVKRASGEALWFSKQIIPTIRNEAARRQRERHAPVFRHLGLYGYSLAALQQFDTAEPSEQEELEGLEQLRFLDLGITIRTVCIDEHPITLSGIDSPEDVVRAECLITSRQVSEG